MRSKKGTAKSVPISPFPHEKAIELYNKIQADVEKYRKSQSRNDWAKVEKKMVAYIHDEFPDARGDNTELYIKAMQYMSVMSGEALPDKYAKMIRMLKPESIVRIRRGIVASTEAQKEKEHYMRNAALKGEFNRLEDE